MTSSSAKTRSELPLRLVGSGRLTVGVAHALDPQSATVIGRDPECDVVLGGAGGDSEWAACISRYHLVIECDPATGWVIYDAGSSNGTSLLVAGLPPAVSLELGVRTRVRPNDVIELANADIRFVLVSSTAPNAERPRQDQP